MSKKNRKATEVQGTPVAPQAAEQKSNKPETMAAFLDRLIAENGGEIDKIVEAAKAEAEKRGLRTKFNAGVIKGHIRFREKQAEKKAAKKETVKEEA